MKIFLFFLLVISLLGGISAQADNFLRDLVSQSVVQPIISEQKQYVFTPAVGVGKYSNSFSVQSSDSLQHTNASFYVLGLDINGYSSHVFIPFRDKADRLKEAVDSDVLRLQAGIKVKPELNIDASFSKVIGYYQGNIGDNTSTILKFPELGLRKYNLAATYMKNSDHKSSLFAPISYERVSSSESLFFSAELSELEVLGLARLNNQLPIAEQRSDTIQSAKAVSLLGSIGWSQSKMYENFFWSYSIGVGIGGSAVEKRYVDRTNPTATLSTTVPFGALFGWNKDQLTTGFFASVRSWTMALDQFSLNVSNGNSGYYLAYRF